MAGHRRVQQRYWTGDVSRGNDQRGRSRSARRRIEVRWLPHRAHARARWHGDRLSGDRAAARPAGRAQGDPRGPGRGRQLPRPVSLRVADRRLGRGSAGGHRLRGGRGGRASLRRHALRAGSGPRADRRGRRAILTRRCRGADRPGRRRTGRRPRRRPRPPRRQASQRDRRPGGRCLPRRLRPRQGDGRDHRADCHRTGDRHGRLHGAGADRGPAGGRADRRLRLGRSPVPRHHRQGALRRAGELGQDVGARQRAAAVRRQARERSRPGDPPGDGEGPDRQVPLGRRPRPRRGRGNSRRGGHRARARRRRSGRRRRCRRPFASRATRPFPPPTRSPARAVVAGPRVHPRPACDRRTGRRRRDRGAEALALARHCHGLRDRRNSLTERRDRAVARRPAAGRRRAATRRPRPPFERGGRRPLRRAHSHRLERLRHLARAQAPWSIPARPSACSSIAPTPAEKKRGAQGRPSLMGKGVLRTATSWTSSACTSGLRSR